VTAGGSREPDGGSRGGAGAEFDTSVAHIARVYDYWLGGKDNFAADRAAGRQVIDLWPDTVHSVRANRAFLARAVRFLAGQAGIRQFLDIGTGIPTANNTHEVAQSIAPDSRVVYVDNDPIVLAHARALLVSRPEGATAYIDADARDPARILAEAARVIDFSRPVAIMLIAILHMVEDREDPGGLVRTLMDAVPPGSYLALSHPAGDTIAAAPAIQRRLSELMGQPVTLRDRAAAVKFFEGLEMVDPGMVKAAQWRPTGAAEAGAPGALWVGVARKP
jgi:hypothetical protein